MPKIITRDYGFTVVQDMVPAMISGARTMLDRWRNYEGKEIEVCEQFRLLTSEVISRTAFGSSYLEGILIFETLTKLYALISRNALKIRFYGSKYVVIINYEYIFYNKRPLVPDSSMLKWLILQKAFSE